MKRSTINRLENKATVRYNLLTKHVFSNFYCQGVSLEVAKDIVRPYVGVIAAQSKWLATTDYFGGDDDRSPLDTYGYKSEQEISGNLFYISDRFNCQFRLDWVLGLFE
jgi:hypothetical protein